MQETVERAERIQQALGGRPIAWLAESVGVALSTAHGYVKGKVPAADVACRVADVLGMDLRYYIEGKDAPPPAPGQGSGGITEVPLVDPSFAVVGSVPFPAALVSAIHPVPAEVRCLFQSGSAMRPSVPDGAEVLYAPVPAAGPADGAVCVLDVGGTVAVRRVSRGLDGGWVAHCDNPAMRSSSRELIPSSAFVGEVLWVSHRP